MFCLLLAAVCFTLGWLPPVNDAAVLVADLRWSLDFACHEGKSLNCHSVCEQIGLKCDALAINQLTNESAVKKAVKAIGMGFVCEKLAHYNKSRGWDGPWLTPGETCGFSTHKRFSTKCDAKPKCGFGRLCACRGMTRRDPALAALASLPKVCTVSADWLQFECKPPDNSQYKAPNKVANSLDGKLHKVIDVFTKYKPYQGPIYTDSGILVDFMGLKFPKEVYCNHAYTSQPGPYAIRARQCILYKRLGNVDDVTEFRTRWPVISEEYLEYADVLEAVAEYASQPQERPFTFIELGAGYGHWTLTAHVALMQLMPRAQYKYVLVEAVGEMVPVIKNLAQLNGVRMGEGPDAPLVVHNGYLGTASSLSASKNADAYTKEWGVARDSNQGPAKTITMRELAKLYNVPCIIDVVDIDIQGAEYSKMVNQLDRAMNGQPGLMAGNTTIQFLTERVRWVHFGTHHGDNLALIRKFTSYGWTVHRVAPAHLHPGLEEDTGRVAISDGILSFTNSREKLGCASQGER